MQWDNTTNAGFSKTRKTWLPVNNDFNHINVEMQKLKKKSHLKIFQKLMDIRRNPTMKYGDITIKAKNDNLLAYKRTIRDDRNAEIFAIVLNLGPNSQTVDLNVTLNGLPKEMKILISSIHFDKE